MDYTGEVSEQMNPSYFLVSVSNRHNLDLCIKYSLAGFPNSYNGVWTYYEINEGDYISFLFGARAFNLYQVIEKEAIQDAEDLPPWPKLTFQESGRSYYFPFRLRLQPIRRFEEPLIRHEFTYVAENLLLRAGYRKTHFQADQTTLQNVSQLGVLWDKKVHALELPKYKTFRPKFTRKKAHVNVPTIYPFRELMLQTLIRQSLQKYEYLERFVQNMLKVHDLVDVTKLEILGEKAIAEGHIDLLIKEAIPIGRARKIIVEVKLGRAAPADFVQVSDYMKELGPECVAAAIVAEGFSKEMKKQAEQTNIYLVDYSFSLDWDTPKTFWEMLPRLLLETDFRFQD